MNAGRVLAAGLAVAALAGCSPPADIEDPGVAQCRAMAITLTVAQPADIATRADIAAVRSEFEVSSFDDLRVAGENYLDAVGALLYRAMGRTGDVAEVLTRRRILSDACREYGVTVGFGADRIVVVPTDAAPLTESGSTLHLPPPG